MELPLTAKEFAILELLMKYPDKVFSKSNLFQSVWNTEYFVEDNTLNVHISNLRNKLKAVCPDKEFIDTVWVQLLLKGCRLAFVKSVVASYRIHGDQVSGLAHKSSAIRLSICERQVFFRFFQNCRDVALVKGIFAGDGFVQRLETIDDIPLAVALHYLSCDKRATWAYQYVHDCLQDPVRREAAESRMGITVAGFRDLVRSLADASRPRSMWVRFRGHQCV